MGNWILIHFVELVVNQRLKIRVGLQIYGLNQKEKWFSYLNCSMDIFWKYLR